MDSPTEMQLPTGVTDAEAGDWEVRSELFASSSVRAPSQHGSTCSSRRSTALATAKARAQAARTKAAYSEKEMALKLQKAEAELRTAKAEAELEALRCRKEMEAAIAEAAVLQIELDDDNSLGGPESDLNQRYFTANSVPPERDIKQECYNTPPSLHSHLLPPARPPTQPAIRPPVQHPATSLAELPTHPPAESLRPTPAPRRLPPPSQVPLQPQQPSMLPASLHYSPRQASNQAWQRGKVHGLPSPAPRPTSPRHTSAQDGHSSQTADLAKFITRNQIVSTGLMKFDDKAENYWAWKASFCNVIDNIGLSVAEETDLLIKWLGKESSEQARRLRAAYIRDPQGGLRAIWQRIEECYGTPEAIEEALFARLESFPRISNKEPAKLRDLADLLQELYAAKQDGFLPGLTYLDTARGVAPIIEKLPYNLQEKWMSYGSQIKQQHQISFPPFGVFVDFIQNQAKARNDPSFRVTMPLLPASNKDKPKSIQSRVNQSVAVHKTQVAESSHKGEPEADSLDLTKQCPIHKKPHSLGACRSFRDKLLADRKQYLKDNSICYRCCASTTHIAKNCDKTITCAECQSIKHVEALHPGPSPWKAKPPPSTSENGREGSENQQPPETVSSKCTEVCGEGMSARGCSKICLVSVYPQGQREATTRVYAIIDEQSNKSLARTEFFEIFSDNSTPSSYTLKTCAGSIETSGRRACGYMLESLDEKTCVPLPVLIECNELPNNRSEIPTPSAVLHHPHLRCLASEIPPLDPSAQILLLLGRDILSIHKIRKQINGPDNAPFAQKLDLGWVVIGDVCLGTAHRPSSVTSLKTCILGDGRPSYLTPCSSHLRVKDPPHSHSVLHDPPSQQAAVHTASLLHGDHLKSSVFHCTDKDHQPAPSIDDLNFLRIMDTEVYQDSTQNWVAPLPFRTPRERLPNNRDYAMKRLKSVCCTLEKKPDMKEHYMQFMQKMIDSQHAENAPVLQEGQESWYLPSFGIYHPKKPEQIRIVFDSSAQYEGISLNSVLLKGPDQNNDLLGVLIRFRKEKIAVTADIQHMFYCFVVKEEHRDYLRFLWFRDNKWDSDIVDYRMRVHVFGNTPSPAVAIYCLRRAAKEAESEFGSDVRAFIERDFYVDDALKSFATESEAINLVKRAQEMLFHNSLRLHKITSNSAAVVAEFPPEDLANSIKDLDFATDNVPVQRSLGISWNIVTDAFTFQVQQDDKPFTRRGVLSTINSIFDPLGFLSPVTIQGRSLLRELTIENGEWDAPLPGHLQAEWVRWKSSLQCLQDIQIPRCYTSLSTSAASTRELCVFADASTKAIAAVAYLKVTDENGCSEVGFVLGKAKLAPVKETTIPRLELCAAVLAVEIAETVVSSMDSHMNSVTFYSDSKVVLGYINNEQRRFYVYVSNRVQRIRQATSPQQWKYVPSELNPADHGSRSVTAASLRDTNWLTGPAFLSGKPPADHQSLFDLVDPELDSEIRPQVATLVTEITQPSLGTERFERFSKWTSVLRALAVLIHIAQCFRQTDKDKTCRGWHTCKKAITPENLEKAKKLLIKNMQQERYPSEFSNIQSKSDIPKQSNIAKLCPVVDSFGLLRVGGRITQSGLEINRTNPLIIPVQHHLTTLLVRHHHEQVKHQGRHFTEGAIRDAGLWLVGGKRCIRGTLSQCVTCRRLRGKQEHQLMADLPADRLQVAPPFTYVGLDVFGPWEVISRRTRGGQANSKRWAVMFTCLCVRAVHIEVIETLSASSFINALRRFFSIRGPAAQIRSDRGTNFTGASKELNLEDDADMQRYLQDQQCTWIFNPPHASHMGGAWERLIGVARRILDSMFLQQRFSSLTHEVLVTLMAEVCAIMNARPLLPVSTDPENPLILTPSMLLTQRTGAPSSPPPDFGKAEIIRHQWKLVQHLAETFWHKWQREYLSTLQSRARWQDKRPNLQEGDVILMKDNAAPRNHWPMAVVIKTFPSRDNVVRTVDIRVIRHGTPKVFKRPVTELVLLFSPKQDVTCV